jgi:flagellin
MRINTNVSALNAQRNLTETNTRIGASMNKLSSGFRITRAADDAAGLGIANKLRADTRSLAQAAKNAEQGNTLLQVAEGSAGSIQKILERMKELATQAGSDTVDAGGRNRIHAEYVELRDELTRTVNTTKFQGRALLDGTFSNRIDASTLTANTAMVQQASISGTKAGVFSVTNSANGALTMTDGSLTQTVTGLTANANVSFSAFGFSFKLGSGFNAGATTNLDASSLLTVTAGTGGEFLIGSSGAYNVGNSGDYITVSNLDLSAATLTVDNLVFNGSGADARTSMTAIDNALGTVATALGSIGAAQNRMETAISNLRSSVQNFTAAESVIRDVDMAEEMTNFSKNNILAQAGTAMLAQANQSAQNVLQLLRG